MAGSATDSRLRDSLETAFSKGRGRCWAFVEEGQQFGLETAGTAAVSDAGTDVPLTAKQPFSSPSLLIQIDGRPWRRIGFSTQLACDDCGIEYPPPEPRLYSFNSPLGACPECEGFGNIIDLDMDLVVPDPGKSLREGAIAPWNIAGLRPRVGGTAGPGRRTTTPGRRAVSRA